MSVPGYESYRDSGVEGLGAVPAHWNVAPAKYAVLARSGGASIKGECADAPEDGLFQGYSASGPNVWLPDYEHDGPGLVLSAVGARCGKVFKADGKWGVVANTHCLLPRLGMDRDFLWYLTNDESWWEKGGTAQPFVKVPDSLARKIGLPPALEQTAIAAFLDRETAKIDALVEAQRRLIELLKEKRQAIISHAVTKGLDPAAPMKESGVEWLGEVPAHWGVSALVHLVDPKRYITYGIVQPGPSDPNGRFMVRGQDYSRGWVGPEEIFRVSAAVEEPYRRARLAEGDLVMTIVGAGVGNVEEVPAFLDGANITQTTARIAPNTRKVDPDFLRACLVSGAGQAQVGAYQKGAAQPGLNIEHLKAFRVALPPLAEQKDIARALALRTSRFEPLIAAADAASTLLQERRAALISAAVTGKIDVRGLAPDRMEAE